MDFDPDRATRYRQLATEARRAAALSAQPHHREAYANIAKGWASLADHVEHERFESGQTSVAGHPTRVPA